MGHPPPRPAREKAGAAIVICLAIQKGGAGKTLTTINLAAALKECANSVQVLDLDRQRHACLFQASLARLGIPVVDEAISDPQAGATRLRARSAGYAFTLLDCPPTLGVELAAALLCADLCLVPLPPERLPVEGLAALLETIEAARRHNWALDYLIVFSRVKRDAIHAFYARELRRRFGPRVSAAVVPERAVVNEMASREPPAPCLSRAGPAADAYRQLALEIIELQK